MTDAAAPAEQKLYKPAKGKRIPMPGNQGDWPDEGRAINPLSGWENRLVADGDLVPVRMASAKPDKPAIIIPPEEPAGEPAGLSPETPANGGNQ